MFFSASRAFYVNQPRHDSQLFNLLVTLMADFGKIPLIRVLIIIIAQYAKPKTLSKVINESNLPRIVPQYILLHKNL